MNVAYCGRIVLNYPVFNGEIRQPIVRHLMRLAIAAEQSAAS